MLLNIQQRAGQLRAAKKNLAESINSVDIEKPWASDYSCGFL